MTQDHTVVKLLPVAVGVVISVTTAGCAQAPDAVNCGRDTFSARSWLQASPTRYHDAPTDAQVKVRRRQADILVTCKTLSGKTKREVRRLLGPPEYRAQEENAWFYEIGPGRGSIDVDAEMLGVSFRGMTARKTFTGAG